jgi:CheY-like chemotaxis protein
MNGVLGMTQLLLDTHLTAEQLEFAQIIRSSAENLLRILNDILDFTKIESDKLSLERVDFDLREVVEGAIDLLAPAAHQRQIELVGDMAPDVPERLCGDPHRIRQILVNLLGNGLKFTDKGEVCLEVECAGQTLAGIELRFTVHDTGIGIPPAAQGSLFQPFTQADGSTTRRFGGTGLGLAICRRLAELMGGQIGLRSQEGSGSSFWFTAKFERAHAVHPPDVVEPATWAGRRVLLVDSHARTQRAVERLLTRCGIGEVSRATSAEATLESLQQAHRSGRPFDLALVGALLDGKDGLGLIASVRSDPNLRTLPVILLARPSNRPERVVCDRLHLQGIVSKPVRLQALRTRLLAIGPAADHSSETGPNKALVAGRVPVLSQRLSVLVADDNRLNQLVAQRMLEKLGCRVRTVANGRQVLDALGDESFDVILMDCQMPELDGYETTRRIRALSGPSAQVRIVALTASAAEADHRACLAAGMDGYLPKPVSIEALRQVLTLIPSAGLEPSERLGSWSEDETSDRTRGDSAPPPGLGVRKPC